MGENVIFKNGEIFVEEYNENLRIKEIKPLQVIDFESYYKNTVEFSEDLTIEGFLKALYPFFDKIDSNFIAFSGGFKLNRFYEQMILPADEKESQEEDEVSHIELYWGCEIHHWDDDVHSKTYKDFSLYGSYHGVPKKTEECYFGFSLTNINNWKHYNFKLNTDLECHFLGLELADSLDENGERKKVFSASKHWNLFDVISVFINELTFNGYPENTTDLAEELAETSKELKASLEAGEVEETYTLDEMLISFLEKDLISAKEIENYEGMKKIQAKIDKLKIKKDESKNN